MTDPEPTENISGGTDGGGVAEAFPAGDPETATRAEAVVDRLGELYWQKSYGGQDGFACLVRTILSQNTSDKASQPAFDSLMARYADEGGDLAATLAEADHGELAETIRAGGLYNRKATVIIAVADEVLEGWGSADAFDSFVREAEPAAVRRTLLDLDGVGPKTADCVLLFAGGRAGVFPVDTHVHRIYRRTGIAPPDADHEVVREILEREVPAEKCGFGHTASIQFGREFCKATKPACLEDPEACPMTDLCEQVGVYPEEDEVVDPVEVVRDP